MPGCWRKQCLVQARFDADTLVDIDAEMLGCSVADKAVEACGHLAARIGVRRETFVAEVIAAEKFVDELHY